MGSEPIYGRWLIARISAVFVFSLIRDEPHWLCHAGGYAGVSVWPLYLSGDEVKKTLGERWNDWNLPPGKPGIALTITLISATNRLG